MTSWPYRKNGLIGKMRLFSKLMTSQAGWQTIAIHYCPISHPVKATSQLNLINGI